jgi:hypothetical protein
MVMMLVRRSFRLAAVEEAHQKLLDAAANLAPLLADPSKDD